MQTPKIVRKKNLLRNKKGAGLVMGLVMGIAALVIAVIIAFTIVSTIADVEEGVATLLTATVINESGNPLNDTPWNLSAYQVTGFTNPVAIEIWNATTDGEKINVANASISATGQVTNGTTLSGGWDAVLFSYTYDYKRTTITTEALRANFTKGVDNVSSKIPTILLIAAVVLIFGILILLWNQYKRMNVGGSGSL